MTPAIGIYNAGKLLEIQGLVLKTEKVKRRKRKKAGLSGQLKTY